jgi:phosphoribosylformimino-5-aminoimidazole carboxamide ribotide isomerase
MPLQIIPSIDLRHGKVVRLKQGDYGRQINYDLDPIATAKGFQNAGATWFHIVDLDGAKQGKPVQTALIGDIIAATGLKVQVGGGIRMVEDIEGYLHAGASRIVLGTKAITDWPWFEKIAHEEKFADKLVLSLDAKDGIVATHGWTAASGQKAVDIARQVSDWPLAAILYTDVAKDGMMGGPNLAATAAMTEAGKVPMIASGGVGNIEHIRQLTKLPVWGVIVGRSLHEGTLDLAEAIRLGAGGGRG